MNLGQLDEENEKFVNNYKEMGYATRTQVVNEALMLLRRKKKKQLRNQWRAQAFAELTKTKPDLAFETFEGEDFVDKTR